MSYYFCSKMVFKNRILQKNRTMKLFKKIAVGIAALLILLLAGGYIYFDQKFTPENNYLTVKNESGTVPITWPGSEKNVMLLPIHFAGNPTTYYLQFDTGSPYTIFYSGSIGGIPEISFKNDRVKTSFFIGQTEISSDNFKIFKTDKSTSDTLKIIGTLGADILENRKTIINFGDNNVDFNIQEVPENFKNKLIDFQFKKRKIIIPGILKGEERKFLYDSGTSAFELLTYKEEWEILKSQKSRIKIEKSRSWDHVLTTYTANCDESLIFKKTKIPLNAVTYVEGFSAAQFSMMKFSGMSGMLGNKVFLHQSIFIDCNNEKIGFSR